MQSTCKSAYSYASAMLSVILLALVVGLPFAQSAHAASLTFAWDYTGSGATGFMLHCGDSSGSYTSHSDVGNTTTYTLSGLIESATYFCAVTAYDSSRTESGYSNETRVTVPTAAPSVSFSATPASGVAPLSVTFSNNTTGSVTSWAWTFGDGTTSTLKSPTKTYGSAGTYTVTLKATGAGGSSSKSTTITASAAAGAPPAAKPVVDFSASPMTGKAPLTVVFTNTTTGQVTSWNWNFGDGTSSTQQNPTKIYSTAGSYTMTLTATGPGGSASKTSTPITVSANTTSSGYVVAAYAFEESSGSIAADGSGNGHSGTISGATRTASGKSGSTLTFDGVNDWVTVQDSNLLDLTTNMTLAVWVYPTALSGWRIALMKEGTGEEIYSVYANTDRNRPAFAITTSSGLQAVYGTAQLALNAWTHLAGTYDGTNLRLYVNGAPVATGATTGSMRVSANPLRIGGDSLWGEFFAGHIDEVQLFNRALSATEVQTLANTSSLTADFTASPMTGTAPLAVAFTNATTGQVTAWDWTFGDGSTSTAQSPTKTYSSAGTYTVTLKATGAGGTSSKSGTITVTAPSATPVANFTANPTTGTAPLNVTFNNTTTGSTTSWAWTFGDGTTSSAQNPTKTYSNAGTYTVTLKATGAGGTTSKSATITVSAASSAAPVLSFTASPTAGKAPLNVTFNNTTTGSVSSWAWNFGDGTISTLKSPSKTYTKVGTYTVFLWAINPGSTTYKKATIQVTP